MSIKVFAPMLFLVTTAVAAIMLVRSMFTATKGRKIALQTYWCGTGGKA